MALDFEKIREAAEKYRLDMVRFLREMISHPSESCEEKEVVACIKAEMEKVGFDRVEVDGLGFWAISGTPSSPPQLRQGCLHPDGFLLSHGFEPQ